MRLKLFLFLLAAGFALQSNGQKLKQNGDLSFLKGQQQINVEFDYEGVMVGKKTEDEYVKEKIAERDEKAGMGEGEKWHERWLNDRPNRYEPAFLELINKSTGSDVTFGDFPDAQYTLRFQVTRLEPGWNIGISSHPAQIDGTAYFGETGEEPQAHVTITNAPGSKAFGGNYDVAERLQESFAISGKRLGALLQKKAFK